MIRLLSAALALAGAAFSPLCAQTPDFEALDARISQIVETEGAVGAAVAVADRDGVVFARGYGAVDREAGQPATPDTPFRAGSVSKAITALAAMRLVEEGELRLDARLSEAAPDVEFTNAFEADAPVRVVHLMEHTTGWDDIQLQEYRSFPEGTTLSEGLADNPRSRTARWAPGRYASYANSGPAALGRVIEHATGLAFEDAAEALVFDPLGLESASFEQDTPARRIPSYASTGEALAPTRIWAAPSGALSIGARDLAEFGRVLMTRGGDVVAPETIARMERAETSLAGEAGLPPFGLGIYPVRDEHGLWAGHAGAIDAARAEVLYDRRAGFAYALMVNTGGDAFGGMRQALRETLGAGAPAPAPAQDWRMPDGAAGVYRLVNPRQELTRPLADLFDPVRLSACDGALCVARGLDGEAERHTPLGGGRFAKAEAGHERIALIETGPGRFEIAFDDGETFRRTSALRLAAPVALWVATLIAVAAGLVTLLVFAAGRAFGAFKDTHRWRVWIWPSLSVVALAGAMAALVALSSGDVLANFAGPSLGGRLIQAGTFSFGPIAVIGLWAAFRARGVRLFARIQAGATSALLVFAWAWMAVYGWAGLTPWSYTPQVFG